MCCGSGVKVPLVVRAAQNAAGKKSCCTKAHRQWPWTLGFGAALGALTVYYSTAQLGVQDTAVYLMMAGGAAAGGTMGYAASLFIKPETLLWVVGLELVLIVGSQTVLTWHGGGPADLTRAALAASPLMLGALPS